MGLELLIFLISPIINAWWDSAHGETHHLRSWFIRAGGIIILAIGISILFPNPWAHITGSIWWIYILVGAGIEFMFFDDLYNWFAGNKFGYIGAEKDHEDDFTWKIYSKLAGWPLLSIKFILLMTAISIYFQLDRF